jgi:hypothetical protein
MEKVEFEMRVWELGRGCDVCVCLNHAVPVRTYVLYTVVCFFHHSLAKVPLHPSTSNLFAQINYIAKLRQNHSCRKGC